MSAKRTRTTVQDIARALGVSRNTVSKALNRHPEIPEDTRIRILAKARELNYKSLGDIQGLQPAVRRDILVICKEKQLATSSFFLTLVQALSAEIRACGGTPIAQFQSMNESEQDTVSAAAHTVSGIIATETLSVSYITQLLDMGKPLVFFDFNHNTSFDPRPCDIVNSDPFPLCAIMKRMYDQGARSFGFIGDPAHCYGFSERYATFSRMVNLLPVRSGPDLDLLPGWRREELAGRRLADAYVCANDYLALPFIQLLKSMGKKVPEEIQVCGFDGISEGESSSPPLTTVRTSAEEIAGNAVTMLFDRIAHPNRKKRILNVETEALFRGTVR